MDTASPGLTPPTPRAVEEQSQAPEATGVPFFRPVASAASAVIAGYFMGTDNGRQQVFVIFHSD
ncbi:MAG: hypothetical protein WBK69_02685 [bacterium]